nr:MAG TPA: hypothetical protein [Bacteriophage sp.]
MKIIILAKLVCNLLQCIIGFWSRANYIGNSLSE